MNFKYNEELNSKGYVRLKVNGIVDQLEKLENDIKFLIISVMKSNFSIHRDKNVSLPKLINELKDLDLSIYFKIAKSAEHLISLYSLYTNSEIQKIIQNIFGHDQTIMPVVPRLHIMGQELNTKINTSGGYSSTPIHQDWFPLQSSINTLTLWFPITNDGVENFPLEVIEGSHKFGPIKTEKHKFGHEILEKNLPKNVGNFEKIFLKKGEVLIFNMFFIHKTSTYFENNLPRVACGIRFSDIREQNYINKNYYRPFKIMPDYLEYNENEIELINKKLNSPTGLY